MAKQKKSEAASGVPSGGNSEPAVPMHKKLAMGDIAQGSKPATSYETGKPKGGKKK